MIQMVTMPMPTVTLPAEVICDRPVQHEPPWPPSDGCVWPRRLAERWNHELRRRRHSSATDLDENQIFVDSTYVATAASGWSGYRPLGAITTK